jgi:hypothetical protein
MASVGRTFVIASVSEAIQGGLRKKLDCFVAELVIGPATSSRTRWLLAMTATVTGALHAEEGCLLDLTDQHGFNSAQNVQRTRV